MRGRILIGRRNSLCASAAFYRTTTVLACVRRSCKKFTCFTNIFHPVETDLSVFRKIYFEKN